MSVILVFLQKAITQGIPLLLGANGEILTEEETSEEETETEEE